MTNELLALIATYFACSEVAAERHLTSSEVQQCATIYQEVKFSFLPGVDIEDYVQLSAPEKNTTNRAGFLAFHQWRQTNPDLVMRLQRAARGEGPMPKAG